MTSNRTLRVTIVGDSKDAERAVRELEVTMGRLDNRTAASQRGMSGVNSEFTALHGKALLLAGSVGAATAAIGVGVGAVMRFASAASDLGESQSKVNTILGDSSRLVHQFANDTAASMGLSQRAAFEAAGGYANMFNTIGLGQEEAAGMSVRLVQLAADMASFNNADPSEMLVKLRAGLAGEAEPLRTMGVLLSEARVKSEAYASGIATVGAELTEAEKVQARYQLILKDTQVQHGDFNRTIGESLPNSMRQMGAAWDDLQVTIGEGVSGPMKGAVDTGTSLIGVLDKLIDRAGKPIKFTVQMLFDPTQWLTDNVFGQPFGTDPQNPERSALGRGARSLEDRLRDKRIPTSQWGFSPNDMQGPVLWADDVFDSSPGSAPLPTALDTQRDMDFQKVLARALEFGKERERATDPITGLPIIQRTSGGSGGGSGPTAFGAGSLGMIDSLLARAPGSPGAGDIAGFDAAALGFKNLQREITGTLAELGLTMADLDARGLEQTDTFKAMEEQVKALRDASGRLKDMETLRLDTIRDSIDLAREAAEAEKELGDARRRENADMVQRLGGMGFSPALIQALQTGAPGQSFSSADLAAQQPGNTASSSTFYGPVTQVFPGVSGGASATPAGMTATE